MGEEASARRWITCTGLGCAALIAIAILIAGGFLGSAWLDVRNQRRVERALQPALPPTAERFDPQGAAGRVVLTLTGAEVHLRAAAPGESLRIETAFDERIYRLEESLDDKARPWVYTLSVHGDVAPMKALLRGIFGGRDATVDVFLPTDVPIDLAVAGNRAAFTIDLARLRLTRAAFDLSEGGVVLEASESTVGAVDAIELHGSMGAYRLLLIGNASPRRLLVDTRMSGLEVDLRGDWRNDSSVTLRSNRGGATLRLPPQVRTVGLDPGVQPPLGDEETTRPTLTFTVARDEIEVVE
jgi:hypothetical protein